MKVLRRKPSPASALVCLGNPGATQQAGVKRRLTRGVDRHRVDAAAAPNGLQRRVLPRRRRRQRHAAQAASCRVPLQDVMP